MHMLGHFLHNGGGEAKEFPTRGTNILCTKGDLLCAELLPNHVLFSLAGGFHILHWFVLCAGHCCHGDWNYHSHSPVLQIRKKLLIEI